MQLCYSLFHHIEGVDVRLMQLGHHHVLLCDNVLLGGVAIEGVVFGGNIYKIERLNSKEIVLYVKAVCLQGSTLNFIVLLSVMSLKNEALLGIVCELGKAERLVFVATR